MAQIKYSSGDFHLYRCESTAEAFPVTESSVREQIVQKCLSRFYEKHSTIERYTGNKTQFIASSTSNEESDEKLSGLISCEALKKRLESSETRRILESADLNQEEISLLLETCKSTATKSVPSQITKDVPGQENTANLTSLQSLLEKLSRNTFIEHNPQLEQFKDVLVFESKREFEAAVRDGVVDRELHCQQRTLGQSFTGDAFVKVISKKRPAAHPDHPLNHLAYIDSQLFSKKKKLCERHDRDTDKIFFDRESVLDKIPTCLSKIEGNPSELCLPSTSGTVACDHGRRFKSQWDVRESEHVLSLHKPDSGKKTEIIAAKKKIDFSKEFVLLPKVDDLLPIALIKEHCISSDELLKEFPQYSRGIPSKTLYLKNVHKHVTPTDLVSLFGHFDRGPERATYRLLLAGRMRGQAFVKFTSVSDAAAALEACLGFKLKGKPLVIQYGKHY